MEIKKKEYVAYIALEGLALQLVTETWECFLLLNGTFKT